MYVLPRAQQTENVASAVFTLSFYSVLTKIYPKETSFVLVFSGNGFLANRQDSFNHKGVGLRRVVITLHWGQGKQ